MNTIAEIRTIMLVTIVLLGMVPVASIATAPRYEGIQLVRYVLETDHFTYKSIYWSRVKNGTLTYDNKYRDPFDPLGPTPIDCTNTRRIGVTFIVNRLIKTKIEHVTTRFVWTHSNVESNESDTKWTYTHSHSRAFLIGHRNQYFSGGLNLTDELRVDGIISVRVTIGKHEILENSFSLSQCTQAS